MMMLNRNNDYLKAESMAKKLLNKVGTDSLSYTSIFFIFDFF